MDLRQHAQVRHHEDAVFGERRDPLRLEGVDEHGGRLLHPRCVREDAAGSDQQVEGHVVDDRAAPFLLTEKVSDRPLLLHALERGGEFLVLHVGQPQGFPRDGLLEDQGAERLRNRRRPDHLVFDPVAQGPLVHVDVDPAEHVGHSRPRHRRWRSNSSSPGWHSPCG